MKYFARTYETATRNFSQYVNGTEGQRSNIAFGAAGNLSRAASHRLSTISNVSHDKSQKKGLRKIMLDLFKLIVEPEMCQKHHWTYLSKWQGIDEILQQMNIAAAYTDETNYIHATLVNECLPKIEAMKYFIERYGSNTDKKVFLPLMTLNPHSLTHLNQ